MRRAYVKALDLIRIMVHTAEGTPGISHPSHEQNTGNLNPVTIFGVGDNNLTWTTNAITAVEAIQVPEGTNLSNSQYIQYILLNGLTYNPAEYFTNFDARNE